MLTFMCHLTLINADLLTTAVTIFSVHCLEASATKWPPFSHDVALATKLFITFKTTEMFHVPAATFSFCTFISKDDLKEK
jgi:hypothetical protein